MEPTTLAAASRGLTGPKSVYRGKLRGARTIGVTFTPEGHAALARGVARLAHRLGRRTVSVSDYLEWLTRRDDKQTS